MSQADRNAEKELKSEIGNADKEVETDAIYYRKAMATLSQDIQSTQQKMEKTYKSYTRLMAEKEM